MTFNFTSLQFRFSEVFNGYYLGTASVGVPFDVRKGDFINVFGTGVFRVSYVRKSFNNPVCLLRLLDD